MNQLKQLFSILMLSVSFMGMYANENTHEKNQDEKNLTQFVQATEIHPDLENNITWVREQHLKRLYELSQIQKLIAEEAPIVNFHHECSSKILIFLQELKSNNPDAIKKFSLEYDRCKYLFEINDQLSKEEHLEEVPKIKNLGDLLRGISLPAGRKYR